MLLARLKLLCYFSAWCNYTYLKNLMKLRKHYLTKSVILFLYLALIKALSWHLVNFISNNFLPPETNVFGNCIMFIQKPWTVDQKGYFTFRSWTKTDFLTTSRQLTVDKNGYAPVFFPCYCFISRDLLVTSGVVVGNVNCKLIKCVSTAGIYSWLENNTGKVILKLHI
jgi:hypothetical protein